MKKIVFGLFACIFFLFSCNLETSFGGTDLVIPLPGSEAKIAKYDAGDVASYIVDITRKDGVHYSETGSAGGVIVFENILCGTYTVDIYALDGDTYVAARGSASIEIIKNEENYLSAEAVLQNKVTDFFVSVPKGVWNLNHARYFREKNYYSAVRDVEYGAYGTYGDGGTPIDVTTAKIVNPEVEYAYLNCISSFDLGVPAGKSAQLNLNFKAEKKCKFSVSVVNSLKEEYGKTVFYEYDPSEDNGYDGYMLIDNFEIGQVEKAWNPLVRICFSKDCGQVSVYNCRIVTSNTTQLNLRYNAAVLPCDKELVSIDINDDNTKFTFDKRKAGSTYTAALFTGMQIEKDKYYMIEIGGVRFDKDVNSLSIAAKSFASKRDLFRSETKSIQIDAGAENQFQLIVPGYMIYSDDYEGAYLEIHPDGYEGDTLEMVVRNVTFNVTYANGFGFGNCFIPAYRDLKDRNVSNVPLRITDGYGNGITYANLGPYENKCISVAVFPQNVWHSDEAVLQTLNFGDLLPIECFGYYIPMMLPNVECNVPGLTFYKSEDYKYILQNNSSCNKIVKMEMNDNGKLMISDVAYTDLKSQYYPENYFADITTLTNIKRTELYNEVKVATVDAKAFTNMQSFNGLTLSGFSCIPVVGLKNNGVTLDSNASFYIEAKTKKGASIGSCSAGVVANAASSTSPYYLYNFNKITMQGSQTLDKPFDIDDTIVEIYLRYPLGVEGDFITIYDFRAGLEASNY